MHAVLGRFVHSLNLFCKDRYDMDYDVEDYWIYEFAKVGKLACQFQKDCYMLQNESHSIADLEVQP